MVGWSILVAMLVCLLLTLTLEERERKETLDQLEKF
jgi:hypothetical protein